VTASLLCGASADRMKFSSMLLFVFIWHILVYCPIAHSNWHHEGFLRKAGVLDWAGGNVVHISAGMSGLITSMVVGKRYGYGTNRFTPNNTLHTITGACFLWVGWFGFNGGSSFQADDDASRSLLMTQIATSCAAFSWILMEQIVKRQPTVLGMVNGAIAGLVSITPAAGFVDPTGAFFIGLLSGPVCYYGTSVKKSLGLDDALDAFGLHGIAGVYGEIMTGLFANSAGATGAFYGNWYQLAIQLYGVTCSVGWSLAMTYLILTVIKMTLGLRVSINTEKSGLDRSFHGEGLYAERSKTVTPSERVSELLKQYAEAKAKSADREECALNGDSRYVVHNEAAFRESSVSEDSSLTSSEVMEVALPMDRVIETKE
jgi:ammonium transporter, Amt family